MVLLLQCTGPVYVMSGGFECLLLQTTYIVHDCNQIILICSHSQLCDDVLVCSPIHDSGVRCLSLLVTVILIAIY